MFAKWPILAEKASLRRVNAAWLSRSERRAYAYSTLRPPTFSGDSLASAVWLTVRPNGVMKLQESDAHIAPDGKGQLSPAVELKQAQPGSQTVNLSLPR